MGLGRKEKIIPKGFTFNKCHSGLNERSQNYKIAKMTHKSADIHLNQIIYDYENHLTDVKAFFRIPYIFTNSLFDIKER